MKLNRLLASIFTIALIALASLAIVVVPVHALPTTNIASIASCENTTSGLYDTTSDVLWQVCYDNGNLYKLDYSTNPATVTPYAIGGTTGTFNVIATVGDASTLYLIGRFSGQVFSVPKSSPSSVSVLASGIATELLYPTVLSGSLYIPNGNGVAKVSTSTGTVTQLSTGTQMSQCVNDGVLVICVSLNGSIYEINPGTDSVTLRVSGLGSTFGICVSSTSVFLTLTSGTPNVLKVSRTTWGTTNTATTAGAATAYGIGCYLTYIGVSTQGGTGPTYSDRDFIIYNQSNLSIFATIDCPVTTSPLGFPQCRPLYFIQFDGVNWYVGFQGSSGSVKISGWETATTTTTSTTSTATTDASGCVIGTQCAGTFTPIVIPTIHVSSITRDAVCDTSEVCLPDNKVTISGFEFFMAGPSSGDFLQMAQLVGCCAAIMSNLNPSNGTFATMSVTATPYALNWYSPTPDPVMDSPLIPTSATKFGWLCRPYSGGVKPNTEYIVQYVIQCDGNSVPINYRTFSFTAPIHTIVQIQATGTESGSQVSVYNTFT